MSPKLKVGATVAALLGFAGLLEVQQLKIKHLMAENADLRSQLVQMSSLQDSNEGLAQQLKADLLLIDDVRGRKAAGHRRIDFTGTIGVLELAADQGLLDLEDAFARLKNTDFWISPRLLDERLKLQLARRRQG